ncbi:MAG TPA: alpha/beta fold hydrolase, partial [Bryobacteraceae bacterium]|nr:alpha/beta fold hydrolase [Bryobacteraceae bacterium]
QLPGREGRIREAPYTRMAGLLDPLLLALQPLFDRPFAFFGHSLGALIAFELTRELARRNAPGPVRLFASARRAPHLPHSRRPIHHLPAGDFIRELKAYKGTPGVVLDDADLRALLLPMIRADFAVNETYTYAAGPLLACPISGLGGVEDDHVNPHELAAWKQETQGGFSIRMFPGGHFYLRDRRLELLKVIADDLAGVSPAATRPARNCHPAAAAGGAPFALE